MKTEKYLFTQPHHPPQGRPRLAVTLGDPAGIGPEVVLKALADEQITQDAQITVIGSRSLLQTAYKELRHTVDSTTPLAEPDNLSILDIPLDASTAHQITLGRGNAASGDASFAYLKSAIAQTLAGEFEGIVTAPIAKSFWKAAGHDYPGQTEVLAQAAGVERFGMLFVARSPHTGWLLRTLLATTHIPLHQVPHTLTPDLMKTKLDLLVEYLRLEFGVETPRIAISGLNPHSGEQGQLGREEKDWLIPWLEQERKQRPQLKLDGPVPPDTLWVKAGQAWYDNPAIPNLPDAYLALYHDQGLIPVKLMAFDRAINTTIGLPFVRTSPDHGTAYDIAGQGIANSTSMKAAIQLAAQLVRHRQLL
ncbi:MAG: 4-hydroxythreonine-4-phosphate dehydrogenase PdxA [Coleofasciculus sp. A1-SPW-01]|uniref:4-hydroxythreonine-4-phosphate dehydrogenase PdxA n=1 Tax=Coleofasciculus sp. A1-SPW-01 TaxID=3070819 RepID=UPI0032F27177